MNDKKNEKQRKMLKIAEQNIWISARNADLDDLIVKKRKLFGAQ